MRTTGQRLGSSLSRSQRRSFRANCSTRRDFALKWLQDVCVCVCVYVCECVILFDTIEKVGSGMGCFVAGGLINRSVACCRIA